MRKIGIEDIDDIALGSSLLGSGGGGDPYMGRLEAIAAVKKYGPVELLDIDEVPDTWTVAPICGVGAPSVSLEKGTNGVEYPKVRAMMERILGRKLDAFLLSEAGGMNSMVPISAAARAGLPLINADGMGRAFPGIQQDTFTLNGVSTNPFIIADEKGNCTVLTTINNDWTEEIGREITTACGGQVTTLASPMSGEKMKTSVVVGTVDYAQKLGRIIRTATDADNPEQFFLGESGAFRFFKGKITDVLRETRDGFNFGRVTLEGIGEDKGKKARGRVPKREHLRRGRRRNRGYGARSYLPGRFRDVRAHYHREPEIRQARPRRGSAVRCRMAHASRPGTRRSRVVRLERRRISPR